MRSTEQDVGMKVRHRDTKPQEDNGEVPPVSGEKLRLGQLLEKGFTNTSMHGLPNVYKAPSVFRRVAWFLVVLIGLALVIYQVTDSLVKYLSWPTESSVYVVSPGRLPLPAITFCNLNPIRRSTLKNIPVTGDTLHKMFGMVGENEEIGDVLEQAFSSDNSTIGVDYGGDGDAENENAEDGDVSRRQTLVNTLSSLSSDERVDLGHNITHMLIDCYVNFMTCNEGLFHNSAHGNCYTFNTFGDTEKKSEIEWKSLQHVSGVGPLYALEMIIFVQQDEYISMTEEVGIRVTIHNQTEAPFPDSRGFTVSTGESTYVSLKREEQIRAAEPYGPCGETLHSNMYTDTRQYLEYTQEACRLTCYQDHVIKTCGCGDPYYPIDAKVFRYLMDNGKGRIHPCIKAHETLCYNTVYEQFAFSQLNCSDKCPPVCKEAIHDVTISRGQWPSDATEHILRQTLYKAGFLRNTTPSEEHEFIHKNVLKLRIYFGELSVRVTETKASYNGRALLSDVGGLLGLYLGLSIITICEFAELVLDMCRLCCGKKQP